MMTHEDRMNKLLLEEEDVDERDFWKSLEYDNNCYEQAIHLMTEKNWVDPDVLKLEHCEDCKFISSGCGIFPRRCKKLRYM